MTALCGHDTAQGRRQHRCVDLAGFRLHLSCCRRFHHHHHFRVVVVVVVVTSSSSRVGRFPRPLSCSFRRVRRRRRRGSFGPSVVAVVVVVLVVARRPRND